MSLKNKVASTVPQPPTAPFDVYTNEPTEIVIGLVGPLGTDQDKVIRQISDRLRDYGYNPKSIRFSADIIPQLAGKAKIPSSPAYDRALSLIELGNQIRLASRNNAILAIACAAEIAKRRPDPMGKVVKTAYIIGSLKHPDEVEELRKIYSGGFYLFAVHTDRARRVEHMRKQKGGMPEDKAIQLILRDEGEKAIHGQHTRDTFHLADFFVADEGNDHNLRYSIRRCLDLMFGKPTLTPTFNEFAMFMAFASSLRSADLSRQVGAVIAKGSEILATGANDCPRAGGGLYWPFFTGNEVVDEPGGRDYMRGFDSNAAEKQKLVAAIAGCFPKVASDESASRLKRTPLDDITEYGRVVHAEMEALLACARSQVSSVGATLYCTTFPCHNCAKHIIAAGIHEVVYIEPYPKSKALEFHSDAVTTEKEDGAKVRFKPFIGVGPRKFFDLFSMSLGAGSALKRKDSANGTLLAWREGEASPRIRMLPVCHRDFESVAKAYLEDIKGYLKKV